MARKKLYGWSPASGFWYQPDLLERDREMQIWEWVVLADIAGGMGIDEICDDTGCSLGEIHEAVEKLELMGLMRHQRRSFLSRITDHGRQCVRRYLQRRDEIRRQVEEGPKICPHCGRSSFGRCWCDRALADSRVPPSPLQQLPLFEA